MAVYNTPFDLARRAIDSVLRQTFRDYELIILDDGSDCTLSLELLKYSQLHQAKISYLRHQNVGQSLAINRAIPFAQGKYISIIDSDDEYKPNHLEVAMHAMKQADLVCSLTDTVVSCKEDYYVPDKNDLTKNIHVDECYLMATFFGKKEVFQSIPLGNIYSADSEFFERASRKFRVKKLYSRTYIYYRNVASSITATLKSDQMSMS